VVGGSGLTADGAEARAGWPAWLAALRQARDADRPLAVATVVSTWGSAPQPVGSKLLVSPDGPELGSVSGGCAETQVIDAAWRVLEGQPEQLLEIDVADELALDAGLSCGGRLAVWVERASAWHGVIDGLERAVARRRATAVVMRLAPGGSAHRLVTAVRAGLVDPPLGEEASGALSEPESAAAHRALANKTAGLAADSMTGRGAAVRLFVDVLAPRPRLYIAGAVDIAVALSRSAAELGFEVMVVDPRAALARRARFPCAERVIEGWPAETMVSQGIDADCYVAALSHVERIDLQAIEQGLRSGARYVGVLGSSRTVAGRRAALEAAGVPAAELRRLRGPIGLSIGAVGAAEIAVAVAAELVEARRAPAVEPPALEGESTKR